MNTGLEERFEHLRREKEKDLVQGSKAIQVEELDSKVEVAGGEQRSRHIGKEILFFLGAAVLAAGVGFVLWKLFADQIVGAKFEPIAWEPPDEELGKSAAIKIKNGIWRAGLGQLIYSLVCLLGIYLSRLVIWAVTHILPGIFDEEQ